MSAVRYTEITCKAALNRVQGMPFPWSLNPYRGCAHDWHFTNPAALTSRWQGAADVVVWALARCQQ